MRSSATAEDLPEMSFAGQQDTYLNISGQEQLLEAVKRCWASLFTPRAIGYRLRMDIDQRSVSMAVVVQRMVPSDVSGVLFTANPTTGDRTEIVINASYGLGEAVVSGTVTPDPPGGGQSKSGGETGSARDEGGGGPAFPRPGDGHPGGG